MKKEYQKPMIEVESLALDMPVALGCDPEAFADASTISELGYFGNAISCNRHVISSDAEENTVPLMDDDKICYYSNVFKLFAS